MLLEKYTNNSYILSPSAGDATASTGQCLVVQFEFEQKSDNAKYFCKLCFCKQKGPLDPALLLFKIAPGVFKNVSLSHYALGPHTAIQHLMYCST